jgi:2-succinyl-6-hydroxy-2,4-cyclohexadiene-1-carboxylate synthase
MASHARVTLFDLPGHGETRFPSGSSRYTFEVMVDDLADAARRIGIDRATWCGYSLGGRVALSLTIRHPDLVSSLVLESGSPGLADQDVRLERQRLDDALASRIELNGVARFVDEWESLPLWQSQRSLAADVLARQRDVRLRNTENGLANSLRCLGQGSQPSYWSRLREIQAPVLLLTGELDTKYVDIAVEMAKNLRRAQVVVVPGVGHAVHLESPAPFSDLVVDFMIGSTKRESQPGVEMTE